MRILIDALQAGNQSGTGSYTEALLRELPLLNANSDIHAICPESLAQQDHFPQIQLITCSANLSPLGTFHRNIQMARDIRRISPDIVHYPANFARIAGTAFSEKTAMILTVHDLSFLREPGWFTLKRSTHYRTSIGRSVRKAKRILADSQATAQDLQEILHINPDQIDVTPLGVDPTFLPANQDSIESVKQKYNLPQHFVLYVGTQEPRKNIPTIVKAWDSTASQSEFDLVIAGREGWKVDEIHSAIENAQHKERIHRPGFIHIDDLPALLSAAKVLAWPSLWEGFGLPPLEAMACGLPVITSNTSSLPEVVGDAAITIDPLDCEALANAIQQVTTDAALHESLRTKGLARSKEFTWQRTAQLTLNAYSRALEDK